ncbi:hypothetical protein BaRGS_00007466 [Batillaria attramentaria]|uniref:Uncharacterized protein n=1 Tax=Batillaria attramentaria TaxID=370345 RepID=A0ABD0LPD9_9CAEN
MHTMTFSCVLIFMVLSIAGSQNRDSRPRGAGSNALQVLVNALESGEDTSTDLLRYTPSTPAPENINCYVEVPTTTRVGGRCIQFGRRGSRFRPWACEAGAYLDFYSTRCQRFRGGGGAAGGN